MLDMRTTGDPRLSREPWERLIPRLTIGLSDLPEPRVRIAAEPLRSFTKKYTVFLSLLKRPCDRINVYCKSFTNLISSYEKLNVI